MIQISGLDSLTDRLDNIGKGNYTQALNKSALIVENQAKINCPVGDGTLRASITHSVNGNEAEVGTNVLYAPYVEFGTGLFAVNGDGRKDVPWRYQSADGEWHTTSGMMPSPYLYPALYDNRERILDIFKEELKEEVSGSVRLKDTFGIDII